MRVAITIRTIRMSMMIPNVSITSQPFFQIDFLDFALIQFFAAERTERNVLNLLRDIAVIVQIVLPPYGAPNNAPRIVLISPNRNAVLRRTFAAVILNVVIASEYLHFGYPPAP